MLFVVAEEDDYDWPSAACIPRLGSHEGQMSGLSGRRSNSMSLKYSRYKNHMPGKQVFKAWKALKRKAFLSLSLRCLVARGSSICRRKQKNNLRKQLLRVTDSVRNVDSLCPMIQRLAIPQGRL